MFLKELGSILIFLLVLVIFGNIWFHFIESILAFIKRIFCRHKEPPVWHVLPEEDKQQNHDDT